MVLVPPGLLASEIPLSGASQETIAKNRARAAKILKGNDDRVLVVVGPCSIHNVEAALEYGQRLKHISERLSGELVIIMRAYFEKPRTTVGWKGLINDPKIDGSFQINKGLRIARKLLSDLVSLSGRYYHRL